MVAHSSLSDCHTIFFCLFVVVVVVAAALIRPLLFIAQFSLVQEKKRGKKM